jgi:hypothetical protein
MLYVVAVYGCDLSTGLYELDGGEGGGFSERMRYGFTLAITYICLTHSAYYTPFDSLNKVEAL